MELHKAAQLYRDHRHELDLVALDACMEQVWSVAWTDTHQAYHLLLHHSLGDPAMWHDPDGWMENYQDCRHITKQRGGTRHFKTLDAVASALQQIGQPVMPLDGLKLI